MSGMEQSLINLAITALGIIGSVTGALVLVSRKLAANGKTSNPGTHDLTASKAHERIDDFAAACAQRHANIERELGSLSESMTSIKGDIVEIKSDIRVIRNGNKSERG